MIDSRLQMLNMGYTGEGGEEEGGGDKNPGEKWEAE